MVKIAGNFKLWLKFSRNLRFLKENANFCFAWVFTEEEKTYKNIQKVTRCRVTQIINKP